MTNSFSCGCTGSRLHQGSIPSDIAYFQAFIENRPLERVKIEDVAAFCEGMEKQGYAVGSIRRRLYAVKSLLSLGIKVLAR